MAYQKKKSVFHIPTSEDIRIRETAINPKWSQHRKCKYGFTIKNPKFSDEVYIVCYGADIDEVKQSLSEHLKTFLANDKHWQVIKSENLKASDEAEDD